MKDKFLFHVPIALNFCAGTKRFNNDINTYIQNKEVHLIGIDRGEKHLAYYSVVDLKGNIVEQGTLNIPLQKPIKKIKKTKVNNETLLENVVVHNYNELLDLEAYNRDFARQNWQAIGKIKDLKDGYISQVVHQITDLAIEHNALIVLEDLNIGFKR